MALTTRCPQCGTAFKVVADQLRVRNGLVRCGVCASVFDGRAHLDEDRRPSSAVDNAAARMPEPAAAPGVRYTPAPPPAPPQPAYTPPAAAYNVPPAPVYTPPPAPARAAPAPVVPEVFRDRSHALRRTQSEPSLEPHAERRDHDYDDDRWSVRRDTPIPQAPEAPVTYDDDLADVRPDLTQWGRRGGAQADAHLDDSDGTDEPVSYNSGFYAERDDGRPREPRLSEHVDANDVVKGEPRTRYVDDYHSGRTPPAFLDDEGVQRRSVHSTLWGAGCIVLLVVLLGLLAHTYRTQIVASFPPLRPLMEMACRPLGCTVGYERRIERISIMSSSLRPPQGATTGTGEAQDLVLTVVLRNRFNAPQPWPALTLELNDLADTVVVRKVILPADYLAADVAAGPFGANAEHRVVLPIAVHDVQVNGYQLDKFFP